MFHFCGLIRFYEVANFLFPLVILPGHNDIYIGGLFIFYENAVTAGDQSGRTGSGGGSSGLGSLLAMGAEHVGSQGEKQLFEAASVLEALAQEGDQILGHVHAASPFALGEGKDPGRMLVATSASGTVLADTGFLDEGQGALKGGPEGRELGEELLLQERESVRVVVHVVCILYHIPTIQEKK